MIYVDEAERHHSAVCVRTQRAGNREFVRFRGITANELKNYDGSAKIQRDKVAGTTGRISLADNCVDLKRPG